MGCFVVPVAEAIVTTIVEQCVKKKENKAAKQEEHKEGVLLLSRKIGWLNKMLWGGSVLLAFEHVWHGEVVPWYPFLTAMSSQKDAAEMFHEMSTVGVGMSLMVTIVWGIMTTILSAMTKHHAVQGNSKSEEEWEEEVL